MAGDSVSGVTIMQMDEGLDTGAILATEETPITVTTTGETLHDALAEIGGRLIVSTLDGAAGGAITPAPQPVEGVTYADKLARDEGRLDWRKPALDLDRLVRAFTPWPGAWFEHGGERIKVLKAAFDPAGSGEPGRVSDGGLSVDCAQGSLKLIQVQRAGKKPISAEEFRRGFDLPSGTLLESGPG